MTKVARSLAFILLVAVVGCGNKVQKEVLAPAELVSSTQDGQRLWAVAAVKSSDDWTLIFSRLGSGGRIFVSVDSIRVRLDKNLDGTYINTETSEENMRRDGGGTFEHVSEATLYLNTKENYEVWNTYLEEQRIAKRESQSPREVIPPGYIQLRN